MTENQLGEMRMIEEVAEHIGKNYPENPDSRYVAKPFDDFLFPLEEGSVDNPITIDEDEASLSQELQSAIHQTTTSDGGKISFAFH